MTSKLGGIFKGKLKRTPDHRIVALPGKQTKQQVAKDSGSKLPTAAKGARLDAFRCRWDKFKTKWVPKCLGAADSLAEILSSGIAGF